MHADQNSWVFDISGEARMRAYARNVAAIGCFARRRLNPDRHYALLFPLKSVQQFDRLTRILGPWVRSYELMHVRVINTYIWSEDWPGGQISQWPQLFLHPMTILAATSVSSEEKGGATHTHPGTPPEQVRGRERGYWFHPPPSRSILTVTARQISVIWPHGSCLRLQPA
jgi:hypothetical protein